MEAYASLFIQAAFVENLALAFFLGMCTLLAVSKRVETAIGLGVAVVTIQVITVPVNYLIYSYLLADGALAWAGLPDVDLSFLGLVSYIGVIAALVQILEMTLDKYFLPQYEVPAGFDLDSYLDTQAFEGLERYLQEVPADEHERYRERLRYELGGDEEAEVLVRILDSSGATVRDLSAVGTPGALNEVHWDGRDADGDPVPSGIYLARITARAGGRSEQYFETIAVAR